jgi:hypothetical protein
MRLLAGLALAVVCAAQTLEIPPVKTTLDLEGQPVDIAIWGSVAAAPSGVFRLSATVDLGGFQEHLTPVLAAQLNRSDRCGERLSVDRAVLAPRAPAGVLTVYVHYERFGCAKAFGKEVVKRLVGGSGVVEATLTPSVAENRIALAAQAVKIDADGSLGEVLRSGSLGDSMREKIAASVESAIRKTANLESMLSAGLASVAAVRTVEFADGGSGRLRLNVGGEIRLSEEQFRSLAKRVGH